MSKLNLQPLKGFRDFLPEDMYKRNWLKSRIISVFEKWGYEPLETPTLESLEIFKGQIGEDEKLYEVMGSFILKSFDIMLKQHV